MIDFVEEKIAEISISIILIFGGCWLRSSNKKIQRLEDDQADINTRLSSIEGKLDIIINKIL